MRRIGTWIRVYLLAEYLMRLSPTLLHVPLSVLHHTRSHAFSPAVPISSLEQNAPSASPREPPHVVLATLIRSEVLKRWPPPGFDLLAQCHDLLEITFQIRLQTSLQVPECVRCDCMKTLRGFRVTLKFHLR